jgi:hypothetical protein
MVYWDFVCFFEDQFAKRRPFGAPAEFWQSDSELSSDNNDTISTPLALMPEPLL